MHGCISTSYVCASVQFNADVGRISQSDKEEVSITMATAASQSDSPSAKRRKLERGGGGGGIE